MKRSARIRTRVPLGKDIQAPYERVTTYGFHREESSLRRTRALNDEPTQSQIEAALRATQGRMREAARQLGIDRRQFYQLCERFGIVLEADGVDFSPGTMGRHVILFLAANPAVITRRALEEECEAIEHELRMTTGGDDLDFRPKWAVSVDEMIRHFNELRPTVVHFSGHGGDSADMYFQGEQPQPSPAHRSITAVTDPGIQLRGNQRTLQHVPARALAHMIGSAAPSARVVVLNACFSDAVADALSSVVDCVVGTRSAIDDDAARAFAVDFYRALGYRRSVGNAVAQAVATLAAKQLPHEHLPICRTRDGMNADQVILPRLDPRRQPGTS